MNEDTHAHAPALPENHYAAPGDLELVRNFANTIDVEDVRDEFTKSDDLEDPSLLREWLLDRNLISRRDRLTPDDLHHALELRAAIRDLAYANHGEPVRPGSFDALDRAAERARLTPRFRGDVPPTLEPLERGADGALGHIVARVFASMSEGTWHRLKICREDTCAWAFYDRSKNQSRAWCSMKVCGNRTKVRNYRSRERSAAS